MHEDHILNVNVGKVLRCLSGTLNASELQKIEDEINRNVLQLIRLADAHLRFARSMTGQLSWRQKVSRGYYAAYSASKAIRLAVHRHYSTDVKDHKKSGDLPSDFPDNQLWQNWLVMYRRDRNCSDYDHTAAKEDLEQAPDIYLPETKFFLQETKGYLRAKGVLG